jgi:hypothetical protein
MTDTRKLQMTITSPSIKPIASQCVPAQPSTNRFLSAHPHRLVNHVPITGLGSSPSPTAAKASAIGYLAIGLRPSLCFILPDYFQRLHQIAAHPPVASLGRDYGAWQYWYCTQLHFVAQNGDAGVMILNSASPPVLPYFLRFLAIMCKMP